MPQRFMDAFAEAHRAAQKAFNEGDFEKAFAGIASGVEWELLPFLPDTGVLHGREAVIRYFAGVRDAGTWRVEALQFIDAGPGRVLVHQRGTATGRRSGITAGNDFFQLFEVGDDGLVVRVTEYESREHALKALDFGE